MSTIYDWSLNAAANANADDIINWSEGQPPSSVNNSARAMMQRMREYIADMNGTIVVTGSVNNLELNSNSLFKTLSDGIVVKFRAIANNNGSTNLNLNGLGARPIFQASFNGVTALTGGEIKTGGFYEAIYYQKFNNGGGGWFLTTPTLQQAIPSGMIASFAMAVAPSGWLECNGDAVSRTTYAELFNAIGSVWGKGDGQTTFNLPDFRGYFLRGWDNGRGIDSGRAFAAKQDSQNLAHHHTGNTDTSGAHTHDVSVPNQDRWGVDSQHRWNPGYAFGTATTTWAGNHTHSFTTANSGGGEARPTNISIFYAIKV